MEVIRTETLDEALAQAGLALPQSLDIPAGAFRRFDDPQGHKGNKAAWVRPFPDGMGATFGNWRTDEAYTWQKSRDRAMTKAEAQAFRQQAEAARADAQAAREAEYQDAAAKANQQWDAAVPATDAAYLVKKAIQPHGTRQQGQSLLVPVLDAQGSIQSLQTIMPDGGKRFLSGGRMAGGQFWIGRPGPTIVICEGFATGAAIAETAGLPVCVAFNAGNLLAVAQDVRRQHPDARIILAADNDIKPEGPNVGRQKAQEAAKAIDGTVALPELNGDACDWWDVRHERGDAALKAVFNPPSRYRLLTGADVAAMPPIQWLVKGVLPATGLAQVYGPSRSGKSFLTLDLALAVAEGREWFGYRVRQAPVVYLAAEGEAGFRLRCEAWTRRNGRPLPDNFFMVMRQPFLINNPGDVLALADVIPQGALTIIDTQNRVAPAADENSSKDIGEVLQGAKTIADQTGGLVLLIAHTGKDPERGVRGHSSQLAAMDAAIVVAREGEARRWAVDKSKDGPDDAEHDFKLDVVELGFDADGDALTSCAVKRVAPAARHKPLTDTQRRAIHAYLDACEAGHGTLDDGGRFIGLHLEAWREAFYKTATGDTAAAKQKAFARARRDLVAESLAVVDNDTYRVITPDATIKEMFFSAMAGKRKKAGHFGADFEGQMSGQMSGQKVTISPEPDTAQCPGQDDEEAHEPGVSA
ncbi:MAG TPA: AAA family ATPase [Castellaniella sp.]|nr:AAA family ATPase [Castellaniella sp.]